MDYPERHPNHIIETECNKYFLNCIPNEWYTDKPNHDYGIDYVANIVINTQVTGLNFSVQLKSIHKSSLAPYIPITLKKTTLNFFNARLEPVLLIVYSQADKEAYWLWYDDNQFDLTRNQKTYTVNIPKENKLSSISWNEIIIYVKNIFSIKLLMDKINHLEYGELTNNEVLAWKNYYQQDYENASFYFSRVIKEKNNDLAIAEALAHSFYMSRKYKEALLVINELITQSGTTDQLLLKASILTEDGVRQQIKSRLLEAKRIFHQLLNDSIERPVYHYNYANALSYLEEYDEAIKHYKISLSQHPNYAEAWKNLGGVYNKLKQYTEEVDCYDKALSINPLLSQALFSKGVTLSQIYNNHKEGLALMQSALSKEEELIDDFPHGYFWLAYANEELGELMTAYLWIEKGLSIIPEDSYLLSYKCRFLSKYWQKTNRFKSDAEFFFETMVSTYNDYRSLYYYIIISNADDTKIIELIHKYLPVYKNISLDDIERFFTLKEFIVILLHYHRYLLFRNNFSIDRYTQHLLSGNFSITSKFWDVIDLLFGFCFSNYVEHYEKNGKDGMDELLLNNLSITPEAILFLVKSEDFSDSEKAAIITDIYLGFPTIIVREFGTQRGFIAGNVGLNIEEDDEYPNLPEQWYEELECKTLEKSIVALGIAK